MRLIGFIVFVAALTGIAVSLKWVHATFGMWGIGALIALIVVAEFLCYWRNGHWIGEGSLDPERKRAQEVLPGPRL